MVEVQMTDDVRKYDVKVMGNFNKRQLISLVIGMVYSVPITLIIPFGLMGKFIIWAILMTPALLCGWVKLMGMTFEMFFFRWMIYLIGIVPRKRKYKTNLTYREMEKKLDKEEERKLLEQMTSKEQKKYLKEKEKGKEIVYSKNPEYKIYR